MDISRLLPGVITQQPLAQYTTFRIGGPAEYFFTALTTQDLIKAVTAARSCGLAFTILGNGSNLLISDQGIKGLVIKNQTSNIKILKPLAPKTKKSIARRFKMTQDLHNLDYDQSRYQPVLVKLDSGVTLAKAIFTLIDQGITGLEWFAGIPATIGGAAFINLHGADKYFSDFLVEAEILDKQNQLKTVSHEYFDYDYDYSRIKSSQDLVLTVTLKLFKGPKELALKIAKVWQEKKSSQPQISAGCVFQNLTLKQQKQLKLPTPSTGYLIDKKLNLKTKQIGQARISDKHAGFIENLGQATAKDVYQLIQLIKQQAKDQLGIDLQLEIVLLGDHG